MTSILPPDEMRLEQSEKGLNVILDDQKIKTKKDRLNLLKKSYGDRICVVGNIDCGQLLTFGTEKEVEDAVKTCISQVSSGGGHIITSSNSIHSSVRPENYLAMINAVRKYGKLC